MCSPQPLNAYSNPSTKNGCTGSLYQDIQDVDTNLEHNLEDILDAAEVTSCLLPESITLSLDSTAKQFGQAFDVRKFMLEQLKERGIIWWWSTYITSKKIPTLDLLLLFGVTASAASQGLSEMKLLSLLRSAMLRCLRNRTKQVSLNTLDDAVSLLQHSKRIMVLTGAGISVNCGIPDFRSKDGLYAEIQNNYEYDINDPQQMFDIHTFRADPSMFYSFAHKIYPANFTPSPCHRFIKLLEDKGKLIRNYTQNIDTLENKAGITKVLQCHGSFATATCLQCRISVPGSTIEKDILAKVVPLCTFCSQVAKKKKPRGKKKRKTLAWDMESESDEPSTPPYVMKPDITFFGERLSTNFDQYLDEDRNQVDLLLIIGTSLNVAPVSEILSHIPHSVPQILINKSIVKHANPDIALLGDADHIVSYLCSKLQWTLPSCSEQPCCGNSSHLENPTSMSTRRHFWIFPGADEDDLKEAIVQNAKQSLHGDNPMIENRTSNPFIAKPSHLSRVVAERERKGALPSQKKRKLEA